MILGVGVMLCLRSFVLMELMSIGFGCIGGVDSPGVAEGGASIEYSNWQEDDNEIMKPNYLPHKILCLYLLL